MVEIKYPQLETPVAPESGDQSESKTEPIQDTDSEVDEPELIQSRPQPIAKSPYSFTPLDRLYALGLESYHLIPRLSVLRKDPWQQYNGQAFRASVREDGNIVRHLEWTSFEKGQIVLLDQQSSIEELSNQ